MRKLFALAVSLPLAIGLGVASASDGVQFTMTETYVDLGETVEFTVTNHRDEVIWFNGFPYWGCFDEFGHGGPCVGVPDLYPLGPGQSETITWDQTDCDMGLPVPAGLYHVMATWSSASQPLFQTVQAAFCIGDDPACDEATTVAEGVEDMTWGRLRASYR